MAAPAFGSVGTTLAGAFTSGAVVSVPASVAANDVILVFIYKENANAVTPPSGFTEAPDSPVVNSAPFNLHVFWKRATAGDTGTYSFTWSGAPWRSAVAVRYTGAITSGNPLDVTASAVKTTTADGSAPAVSDTTTGIDELLVWAGALFNEGTCSTPSGFTERADIGTGNGLGLAVDDKAQAVAGGTGSITATFSVNGQTAVWLGALKPVAAAGGTTLTPGGASLTLTGSAPTVTATANNVITPGGASLVLTGSAPVVAASDHKVIAPAAATLTLIGSAPALQLATRIAPGAATLTLAGSAPTVLAPQTITPGAATLTVTGSAPAIAASGNRVLQPGTAALTLTGNAPTVVAPATLAPGPGTLTLAGSAPTVTVSGHRVITPGAANLTLTGSVPQITVSANLIITPGAATLTLTGEIPGVEATAHVVLRPAGANLVLTGAPASLYIAGPLDAGDISPANRVRVPAETRSVRVAAESHHVRVRAEVHRHRVAIAIVPTEDTTDPVQGWGGATLPATLPFVVA